MPNSTKTKSQEAAYDLEETAVPTAPMMVMEGLGVSPGIVIGDAIVVESSITQVPEYTLRPAEVDAEVDRFHKAVAGTAHQVAELSDSLADQGTSGAEEASALLEAHVQMIRGSRLTKGVETLIRDHHVNAEAAVAEVIHEIEAAFRLIADPYIQARHLDVRDAGNRLIRYLTNTSTRPDEELPEGSIIVTDDMTPADTALIDTTRVLGFAAAIGGAEGHTAIMARSLRLPAVLGVEGLLQETRRGDKIIIDGTQGKVILRPDESVLASYRERIEAEHLEADLLANLKSLPSMTRDGEAVTLQGNIELPFEVEQVMQSGGRGIGLLRSEFMFMNRENLPSEDEQFEELSRMVMELDGETLTVRTLDVGGDKLALELDGKAVDPGFNPALGVRAIRFGLKYRPILETQLAAVLRAAAVGPIRILIPMITSAVEIHQVRRILTEVASRLMARGVPIGDPLPPLGVMIEVPAAALGADLLAGSSDFFSIGTNDLTMYTLAIDRANEQVAHLYDPFNPAVLRLIQFTANSAASAGIPVNICGEMAGDETFCELLVGFGIRELSMAAHNIPRIKRRVRNIDMGEARALVDQVMAEKDPAAIARLLRQRLEERDLTGTSV